MTPPSHSPRAREGGGEGNKIKLQGIGCSDRRAGGRAGSPGGRRMQGANPMPESAWQCAKRPSALIIPSLCPKCAKDMCQCISDIHPRIPRLAVCALKISRQDA